MTAPCAYGFAALGDSLTDTKVGGEDQTWFTIGQQLEPSYAMGDDTLGFPRKWAIGGADVYTLNGGVGGFFPQVKGLILGSIESGAAYQALRKECHAMNILCGSNSASPFVPVGQENPTSYYYQLYHRAEPFIGTTKPGGAPTYANWQEYVDDLIAIMRGYVETLVNDGYNQITLCSAPDHSITPNIQVLCAAFYSDLNKRKRTVEALHRYNQGLLAIAEEFQLVFVDVDALVDWFYGEDGDLRDELEIGGNTINLRQVNTDPAGTTAGFIDDVHPHKPWQVQLLKLIWRAHNLGWGSGFAIPSEQRITEDVLGLTYFGDTLNIEARLDEWITSFVRRVGWYPHQRAWWSPAWWNDDLWWLPERTPADTFPAGVCVGGQTLRCGGGGQRVAGGVQGGDRLHSGAEKGQVIHG